MYFINLFGLVKLKTADNLEDMMSILTKTIPTHSCSGTHCGERNGRVVYW